MGSIITPPLLTLNMRDIESMDSGVKINRNFTCHDTATVFDSYDEVVRHRIAENNLKYVNGIPFQFLEVRLTNDEYNVMIWADENIEEE